ncbi:MAG: SemiSWEET transporter [Desulfovibrionaceae bacterium]|nr:SemiSWEET transporter [Desulfovibrionaceae bacterium]
MEFDLIELVGMAAGCCTTLAFLPQVLHTWRTRSVADLSLRMYCLLAFGVSLWLVYGFSVGSLSIVLANSVTLVLASSILAMKIVYGRRPSAGDFDRRPK